MYAYQYTINNSLSFNNSDFDEEVVSLKQFTTEDIVASVVKCIKTIHNDVDLPNTLPGAMSAKFRMGTSLASHIQVHVLKIIVAFDSLAV